MKISNCRLCGEHLFNSVLSLGDTPIANEFLNDKSVIQDEFPLNIIECQTCHLYQLDIAIDKNRIFSPSYVYVSGTSAQNVKHFRDYADNLINTFFPTTVLEIASNDGTMLKRFKEVGCSVLGIDPAKNVAENSGVETIVDFFNYDFAKTKLNQEFDLIIANNVLAHIEDIKDFVKGVKHSLKWNGIFVFEVSYFLDVVNNNIFDTIYHEHQSYFTIKPLLHLCQQLDLDLFKVERLPNHGGSIRVFITHKLNNNYVFNIDNLLEQEDNINLKIEEMNNKIKTLGLRLNAELHKYKNQGKSIAIYGTPAKATTLTYALNIDESMIDFAVEDNPLKQGCFTPGKHIPIYSADAIYDKKPDILLVLAWNFADNIMKNHSNFKGTWIVPLPEYREIIT